MVYNQIGYYTSLKSCGSGFYLAMGKNRGESSSESYLNRYLEWLFLKKYIDSHFGLWHCDSFNVYVKRWEEG